MKNGEKKVSLFVPCLVDGFYPEVAEATIRIMRKLGISVACPTGQTCCGQPAFNSGYRKAAGVAAKRFIKLFEHSELIVCPSGSCVDMVRHHYAELFSEDPKLQAKAREVSAKTFELTEYLVDVLGVEDLDSRYQGKVTYHESCQLLHRLGVSEQPRHLISNVRGAEFIEMMDADRCCGFGGAFSIKYAQISAAILEEKVKNIMESGADVVVGCDMGCLMNIQGMLNRKKSEIRIMHIAQLLAGR